MSLNKARKIETLEVHFRDAATTRLHSATTMKTEEWVLLFVYLGKRVSRVRVEDIHPEIDVA